jgi:hypothetical protein
LELRPYERYTPRVAEVVARLGTSLPFAEAAGLVDKVLGVTVSETTERRQTYAAGAAALAVEVAELERVERDLPVAAAPPERLQASFDATKVSLVGGEWTDVKLGVFSDLVPGQDAAGQPVLRATGHSYAARWEPADRFTRTVTLEANRRGLDEAGLVLSPNDGADWIQGLLDAVAPWAERILDEMQAAEHLGTIAGLVFGAGTAAAQAWVDRQRTRLRTEPPARVLVELARCQRRGPRPGTPPGPDGTAPARLLAREVAYFFKRADQIRYAEFRRRAYPIGSGTVESGHRVVIGARFKGAGQHWEAAHLNPLLVLRTTLCNDRWDVTWPAIAAHRRATAQTVGVQRQRWRRLARLLTCLRQLPGVPPPVAAAPPAPTAVPPQPPRPRKTSPWRRTNALLFVKDRSA